MIDIINTPTINTPTINDIINIDINNNILHECYVCYENCDEISQCDCIDLYIHKKCLTDTIIKLNNINCTICKKQYNNIVTKTTYYYKISNYGYVLLSNITVSFIFTIIGVMQIYIYDNNNFSINLSISIPFLSMGITMLSIVTVYTFYMYMKYNLCIYLRYQKINVKFIN